jgi:phage terminase small subunit
MSTNTLKLNSTGKSFRRKILAEFALEDEHDIRRLDLAAHCLDRIEECQKFIKSDGLFIKDRFEQMKEHPASKAERDNKSLFARLIRELGLDLEPPTESRPPRQYN